MYFGHSQRFAVPRAGKDDVLHAVAAESAGSLLAQHPANRLDHVRFAAAVGAHDSGDARAKGNGDLLGKGLETKNLKLG